MAKGQMKSNKETKSQKPMPTRSNRFQLSKAQQGRDH